MQGTLKLAAERFIASRNNTLSVHIYHPDTFLPMTYADKESAPF
jgi:hypothetical protein